MYYSYVALLPPYGLSHQQLNRNGAALWNNSSSLSRAPRHQINQIQNVSDLTPLDEAYRNLYLSAGARTKRVWAQLGITEDGGKFYNNFGT